MNSYSDKQVCNLLNMSVPSVGKLRAAMRERGLLKRRQQFDEQLLQFGAMAKKNHEGGHYYWQDAVDATILELQEQANSTKASVRQHLLHTLAPDGSADERANEIMTQAYGEQYERLLENVNVTSDFFRQRCPELADIWLAFFDVLAKAAAFELQNSNG